MPYKQLGLICSSAYFEELIKHVISLGFEVRALWCPNQDLAIQSAAEFEIPFVASRPDEVLLRKEVEMVVIAGKPSLHAQMCIKALGIGKHILCESPATLNLQEAQKMVESSNYYPQILSLVGFGLRHLQVYQEMKNYLSKNFVGTPLLCEVRVHCGPLIGPNFDWMWEQDMGGGVLNLLGSHVIDLLSFLLGKRAERVQGLVKTHGSERHLSNGFRKFNADDFASFLLKFQGDFSATVTLNSLCPETFEQEVIIFGNSGMLAAKNQKLYGTTFGEKEELLFSESDSENLEPAHQNPGINLPRLYFEAFQKVLETLSKALPEYSNSMEKSEGSWKEVFPSLGTVAGFEDAQYVRAVVEAIRRSSTRGDWVKVDLDMHYA